MDAKIIKERRKWLNESNATYFEKMEIYIKTNQLDEKRSNELLLELLEHIIAAQHEERLAEDEFGSDPVKYCKELIVDMPKRKKKRNIKEKLLLFFSILSVFYLAGGTGHMVNWIQRHDSNPTPEMEPLYIAILFFFSTPLVDKLSGIIHYKAAKEMRVFYLFIMIALVLVTNLALQQVINTYLPLPEFLTIPPLTQFFVGISGLVIIGIIIWSKIKTPKKAEELI